MAFLFQVNEKAVFPNTETLLIEPFKTIWERDPDPNKVTAIKEFAYIEFLTSMKATNPYRQYSADKKEPQIRAEVIKDPNWEPDELIEQGLEKIDQFQKEASTTYSYYLSAKAAAEKMEEFFLTFDLTAVNPKTFNPVYKPRDITSALNDTQRVLSNLKALEKKVEEELYEETKNRSNKQISAFADPSIMNKI